MAALGPIVVGQIGVGGFDVFAHSAGLVDKPIAATIDWTTVTAETAARQLPGTFTTTPGDKVIDAGNVLYKLANGKYGVATDTTTLSRGKCFVNRSHISQILQADQVGTIADRGSLLISATQIGKAGKPTRANFETAFPAISIVEDA